MSDGITIRLTGMTGFGHHGVEDDERRFGQHFTVDLELDLCSMDPARTDRLEDTVDYAALAALVGSLVEGEPVDLLERLGGVIAERVLDDDRVARVAVTIAKPELRFDHGGQASVTVRRSR